MQGISTDRIKRPSPPARRCGYFAAMLVSACLIAGAAEGSQEQFHADAPEPAPPVRLAALSLGNPAEWLPAVPERAPGPRGDSKAAAAPLYAPVLANQTNVFGSIAVGMAGIAASKQWQRVLAEDAGRFLRDGCEGSARKSNSSLCGAPDWSRWVSIRSRAAGLPPLDRIALVNREVNRLLRYKDDRSLYGKADHWATLAETVRAGAGDCEDFAIAKMWLLDSLGVPLDSMQLVALRDERRGLDHAVLAVHLDDRILLLDNVHDRLLPDVAVQHYKPMFSFANQQSFVHGFRRPAERLASAAQ
jgi:predicted transglutaminase-like cysteine proteinase